MTDLALTEEEQEKLDSWTKEEIYEAYLTEYNARVLLNKEMNKQKLKLKEIEHSVRRILNDS
jgi:hypothetical protein